MNMDEKIQTIQENLARLPQLSKEEFMIVRRETEKLISEVEEYLETDNLEVQMMV